MKRFTFLCRENVEDAVFRIGLHWEGVEYGWWNSGSWHINITAQRDSHFPPDRLGIGKRWQAGQRRLVWLGHNKRHAATRHAAQVGGAGQQSRWMQTRKNISFTISLLCWLLLLSHCVFLCLCKLLLSFSLSLAPYLSLSTLPSSVCLSPSQSAMSDEITSSQT